jgi:hypothetical protein
MSTGPKSDYDELPHGHTVISAQCDHALCYALASSVSDDQLNNRTAKSKSEASNAPLNTENGQCQETKDNLPSDRKTVIGKMDKITQLNTKTSQEGNIGRPQHLQIQKTEKKIPGTAHNATTSVSLAARKLFKLSHEAEARITTVIDDNFTRLENAINENIFLQFPQIMQLLEKGG